MKEVTPYTRKCPTCGKDLYYKAKGNRNECEKKQKTCEECKWERQTKYKTDEEFRAKEVKRNRIRNSRMKDEKKKGNLKLIFRCRNWGIKGGALRRGLDYKLLPMDIEQLYNEQRGRCYYSGIPLELIRVNEDKGSAGNPYLLSVDRKDSTKGYTKDNVVLCTYICNAGKGTLSEDEFFKLVGKIYRNMLKRKRLIL